MKHYKLLLPDGSDYIIGTFRGMEAIAGGLLCLVAVGLIAGGHIKAGLIILGVITFFIILFRTTYKVNRRVVMENGVPREITIRFAKFGKTHVYPVANILGLSLRTGSIAGIPLQAELPVEYRDAGKVKVLPLAGSLKAKDMQELWNELEDLLQIK
ncbi:hypothetical protein [Chitinophaga qingshengii]|uniref:PH domain-containing protein n=1 Tax=Chitinophaga qingshengii TaxID=1569794 RepID=A0ABR7TUR1_9BACT|nr:hypothetical protein [Chitinophaga qingshengii]MBC9933134.1 hypothetical protein [Chitinophaga qingshengii]